jgi:hypothetical protein
MLRVPVLRRDNNFSASLAPFYQLIGNLNSSVTFGDSQCAPGTKIILDINQQ